MPFLIIGLGLLALFFLVKNVGAFQMAPGKPSLPTGTANVPYADLILMSSRTWGVPSALIKAVTMKESSFNPNATNPSDPSYGLMGITPILAQDFGLVKDYKNPTKEEIANLMKPEININAGARQLSRLLSKYPFDTAIQMYNLGIAKYDRGFRVPEYLAKVKGFYNEY